MTAGARIGDGISCGDTIASGSGNVFFNGMPVARVTDSTAGHGCFPPTTLAQGSPNVFANNLPICRVGDPIIPHTCDDDTHGGNVTVGSPDVFINS